MIPSKAYLCRLYLSVLLACFISTAMLAQRGKVPAGHVAANSAAIVQEKVVRQALRYADYSTAATALHQLLALQGEGSSWRDTLLLVYAQSGAWGSAHLLATELRGERPEDDVVLEIDALALKQLGATREAIVAYELLFFRTKRALHGYELANLQHRIKRLAEAEATLSQMLAGDIKEEDIAVFPTATGGQQRVPLKAAALNLRGLVAYDMKQNEAALGYFRQALEISADFATARQNEQAVLAATAATPAPKE